MVHDLVYNLERTVTGFGYTMYNVPQVHTPTSKKKSILFYVLELSTWFFIGTKKQSEEIPLPQDTIIVEKKNIWKLNKYLMGY